MTARLLHFTLGPVQRFVAQARRTSDLWAGSFLLSWLTGQAMAAAVRNGGTILIPDVQEDALFGSLVNAASKFGPPVGSLPNRFKARVPEGFEPAVCRSAVDEAWRGLAAEVRRRLVDPLAAQGKGTPAIWERQVASFWETAWVIGPDLGTARDNAWLDRRKNWRTHRPPVEGGDHCMLMGEWQELSGFIRSRERKEQDQFWHAAKARAEEVSGNPLQLDENERLCAMALIKRLFRHVAKDVLGWTPSWDGEQPLRWPSTPRLAAADWLDRAWKNARDEAEAFVAVAKGTTAGLHEPELETGNRLSEVAGQLLHETGIESAYNDELGPVNRDALRKAYVRLKNKAGTPSSFYAMLLMDGDGIGALLRESEDAVTTGLARFSRQADAIIRKHGGSTVYAGGDDVLALLPLEGALSAALKLREAYRTAFADMPKATISAAVVFAHFHVPLRHVLDEAHTRLDKVAKEDNGRDSLAICVLAQSGITREWVSTWQANDICPPRMMITAAQDIDQQISGRLFYAIREQYGGVISGDIFGQDDIRRVLLAEYRCSGVGAGRAHDETNKLIDQLLVLAERHAAAGSKHEANTSLVSMNGPLMARFLAQERRPA